MKCSALFLAAVLLPAAVWAIPAVPASAATNRFFNGDGQGGYQYGYDWTFPEGEGAFQRESGDVEGRKQGSYGLKDTDGRVRIVSYIADEGGFRVSVSTNEPGTQPSSPADALFQLPQGSYQAPAYEAPKTVTYQPAKVQSPARPVPVQTVPAVPVAATVPKVAVTAPKVVVPTTFHYHHHHPYAPVIYSHPTGVIPVQGRLVYG
uniref:Putative cuticle protein n=1 Tax=Amblyomma triste TaxID=251400 RepID=A0A023GDD8_AMBTT